MLFRWVEVTMPYIPEWIMNNLMIINILLSVMIIFFQRRDPKTVWTWLLVLYCVPIVGFLLYLVIGQNMHKSRMFKVKELEDKLNSTIQMQEEDIFKKKFVLKDDELKDYEDLVLYNLESSGSVFTKDNAVEVYTEGEDKFEALIEEMKKAKEYIHMQYYIIRDDEVFHAIEKVLLEKVKEGVEVRILYDSMGCKSMPRRHWRYLKSKGIMVGEFFPAILGSLQLRMNYRNHRKIVVIDGKTGFVGGYNVGREYVGKEKKFGHWRDTHLKITGSAVMSLQIRFILDWNYAAKDNLFKDGKYFKESKDMVKGKVGMQIVSSGPDSKLQNIRNNYLKIINKSKQYLYLQTPYLIPDDSILDALQVAALSGVDVRVMIPCKPDHPFVYWATYSYLDELLAAGVKCYTYNDGFLHVKGMISDGLVSSFGTANMDIRSFKLNFEVNAVIYDKKITTAFEESFHNDLTHCTQITREMYSRRSMMIRIKEQISRLLSPIM